MSNTLELAMRKAAKILYDQQVAFIFKVPEAMQQTPCDFFGVDRSGRAIFIECKQVKGTSLTFSPKSNGIKPHQWTALKQAHGCGAMAFVIWQCGDEFEILDVPTIESLLDGRKSIYWECGGPIARLAESLTQAIMEERERANRLSATLRT